MDRAKDAPGNTVLRGDSARFDLDRDGVVRFACGPAELRLDLDAAYELQYRLAEFLAAIERGDYDDAVSERDLQTGAHLDGEIPASRLCPEHRSERAPERNVRDAEAIETNRRALEHFAGFRRPRRLDS